MTRTKCIRGAVCLSVVLLVTSSVVIAQPQGTPAQGASQQPSPQAQSQPSPEQPVPPTPAPPKIKVVMPPPLYVPPPAPPAVVPPTGNVNQSRLPLDVLGDRVGIGQQTALAKGLQARILWIDGTANIGSINSQDKIDALVKQAKQTGFNTIVLDVKPIVGMTLYPSQFAQKLTEWKGAQLPATFDPLAAMVSSSHAQGLKLVANISTFGEGHKLLQMGPTFTTNPDWQTVLYEATRTIKSPVVGAGALAITDVQNQLPADQSQVAIYTDTSLLHRNFQQDGTVLVTDFLGRVIAQADMNFLRSVTISAPPEGAVLVGVGAAGNTLRNQFKVGDIVTFDSVPKYVPISQAPEQKVTMFVNPNSPTVQQHELNIVQEIATNYDIDGMIFDDRMRFAAINADFSDYSKQQFEKYVGHKINWPDDVFKINPYPNQEIIKGPEYAAWIVWRGLTIRNWLAQAQTIVKTIRPDATVSVYVGSWYGEYYQYGSNWAAADFQGPFEFLTPAFQQTGYAGLLDWMTTGCYYTSATIADGNAIGEPGATVEAAGQLSNRAANDQTWVYAGLYVAMFENQPDQFARCLQAAAAATQGIMLFDLSQINTYDYWPLIAQAFAQPATAPNAVPGLLDSLRLDHQSQKAAGVQQPPVVVYGGVSGTGL